MNIHNPELARQHQHYAEVRGRLAGKPLKADTVVARKPDEDLQLEGMRVMISKLTKEVRFLRDCLRHATATDERVRELELSLADAHARILAQADMLKLEDMAGPDLDDDETPIVRRPVRVIVEEVLQGYPGITWEDIKGIRRNRNLIKPRKACIRAVFDERKDLSSVKIGKLFGNRDHSTILHSIRTAP